MNRHARARRWGTTLACLWLIASVGACAGDASTRPASLAGDYTAIVFTVTPSGGRTMDVLAEGGILALHVDPNNSTTGNLYLPASVAGTDMALPVNATAVVSGNTVRFQQTADTFLRDLTFTVRDWALEAVDQTAGTATYTVILGRI